MHLAPLAHGLNSSVQNWILSEQNSPEKFDYYYRVEDAVFKMLFNMVNKMASIIKWLHIHV